MASAMRANEPIEHSMLSSCYLKYLGFLNNQHAQQSENFSPIRSTFSIEFSEVLRIHIDEKALTDDGRVDILGIKPIARMGYYDYTVVDNIFEMKIPAGSEEELAGLEGRILP